MSMSYRVREERNLRARETENHLSDVRSRDESLLVNGRDLKRELGRQQLARHET